MMHFLIIAVAVLQHVAQIAAGPLSRRDDFVCASVGYQSNSDSFITTNDGGYPVCSALCFSQPDCKSFAWSSTECNLYDVPVANNFQSNDESPYFFYDRSCETEHQICGSLGYQATFDSYWWSDTLTYQTCAAACLKDKACKSYAFGNIRSGHGECSLYNEPVTGNFAAASDSPYQFYDVTCPVKSDLKTTTSTKTTTMPFCDVTSSAAKTAGTTGKNTVFTSSTTTKKSASTSTGAAAIPSSKSTTKSSITISQSTSKTTIMSTKSTGASSTVKTSSITSTTAALASQSSSSVPVCGIQDYASEDTLYVTLNGLSYEDCRADCLARPKCKSFAFPTVRGWCNLYDKPATAATVGYVNSAGHYYKANYYDIGCDAIRKIDPICGVTGMTRGFRSFFNVSNVDLDGCFAECNSQSSCKSINFLTDRNRCDLFDAPVTDYYTQKSTVTYFYDIGCRNGINNTATTAASSTTAYSFSSSSFSSASRSATQVLNPSTGITTTKSTTTTSSSSTKTLATTTSKATSTTTKSSATQSLTTTSSAASASSSLTCGQQGYFSGSSGFHGYSTDYDQPTQEALSQCYQYCVNSNEDYCSGWDWSPNNCVLYSYAPEDDQFTASSDSGMYVWDRRCGEPVAA